MLWLLVLISLVIIVFAPARRAFFTDWHITFPAVLGLIGGLVLTGFLARFGVPGWALLFVPPLCALQAGAAGKAWLDQNFGPREGNEDN